jgi:bifunctional non-homologous end joining protein LigD
MLTVAAASTDDLPDDGAAWAYEVKWDGVRVLAHIGERPGGGRLRLVSRAGNEVTAAYPELAMASALAGVHPDAVLDGEVVVMRDGIPSFSALAMRMHVRDPRRAADLAAASPATYLAFDVLRLDGADVTALPWSDRRALLDSVAEGSGPSSRWRASPVYDDRDALLEATRAAGLEGVVAKRRSSRYHPGQRTGDWLKLAHKRVQSTLVGGWRWETGARDRLGALLVGVPDAAGGLDFAGRVGSGITGAVAAELQSRLTPSEVCPFTTDVPAVDAAGTIWTAPRVVVDVRYLGKGEQGRLRQPVFRGIRDDLTTGDVRWEA